VTPAVMQVACASEAGGKRANEDYAVASLDWAVVLDGATAPADTDSGCIHDVRWLVRQLAAAIAVRMPSAALSLADLLAEAITDVRRAHSGTCDLANPDSPASTVAMCRVIGSALEYLSLADSAVLHARPGHTAEVFLDARTSDPPGGTPCPNEVARLLRNQPGGFWVASTSPEAAYEAVHGTCGLADDSSVLLLTDGVTRLADFYGQTWESLAATASTKGPGALIAAVRRWEDEKPPRYRKRHDDATAVHMTPLVPRAQPTARQEAIQKVASGDHSSAKVSIWRRTRLVASSRPSGGSRTWPGDA
jgi:Protein phosphatase 2C